MSREGRRRAVAAAGAALLVAAGASSAVARKPPSPITEGAATSPRTQHIGGVAVPQPLFEPSPPRHPFMAPNERSNIHNDAYQTDVNQRSGPLGAGVSRLSTMYTSDCASITFDTKGRIVTVCVGVDRPTLRLLDPATLDEITSMPLPPRPLGGDPTTTFTDFSGGGYFYLDNHDRAVVSTYSHHLLVVGEVGGADATTFRVERDYDLTKALASSDKIISALPDFSGRIWFISKSGVVGTVDRASGAIRSLSTGEAIGNSFAVGADGGVYIVTDKAMYRWDAAPDGAPRVTWREVYANSGLLKPGQTERGSGTTPTLMGREFVAITDNADPMDIVVYRRAKTVTKPRRVCVTPVFAKGASDTDQSLIGTTRSLVVENNYGYSGPGATEGGRSTTPGLERVDIDPGDASCHRVWHSDEIAPSVVPKLSLGSGLVYTYTKPPQPGGGEDLWYLTALDFRTGKTVYKQLAGEGLGFNNNYAPITIAPDGAVFLGTLGGMVALRDAKPPPTPRVRIAVFLRRLRRPFLRAFIVGPDRAAVRSTDFFVGRRRVARDRQAPFSRAFSTRGLSPRHLYRLRTVVVYQDGRTRTIRRRFRPARPSRPRGRSVRPHKHL